MLAQTRLHFAGDSLANSLSPGSISMALALKI